MNSSLNTGVSALRSFTEGLEVIGNNIANVNTSGYKKSRADYGDNFYQLLKQPSNGGGASVTMQSQQQVGGGVQVAGISTHFQTESFEYTGNETDLAISGNGFFRLIDPSSNQPYYTRAGAFHFDSTGYLVNTDGFRLQGSSGMVQIMATPDAQIANYGAEVVSFAFAPKTGTLQAVLTNNETVDIGQVRLSHFTDPQGLMRQGGTVYTATSTAGTRTDFLPGNGEIATVDSQYLEASNVDLTEEFANMITTQRSFQGAARIITTADQILQEAVNLKR